MIPKEASETSWVVVMVQSGIPVQVEAYRDRQHAETRERLWRERMRPDNDEVGIFEVQVRDSVSETRL